MTRIVAVNGSPKASGATALFLRQIESAVGAPIAAHRAIDLARRDVADDALAACLDADALLIAFPLYVDGLPAPLIRALSMLEEAARAASGPRPTMYAVANCGFYEPEQNRLALAMASHFCERAGLRWGYGVAIGCGGFAASQGDGMGNGPMAPVHAALCELGAAIARGDAGRPDIYVKPSMPRFLYALGGNMGWRQIARRNGVARRLGDRPHAASDAKRGAQRGTHREA